MSQPHQKKPKRHTHKNITEKGKKLSVLQQLHTFVSKRRKCCKATAQPRSQEKQPRTALSVPFAKQSKYQPKNKTS